MVGTEKDILKVSPLAKFYFSLPLNGEISVTGILNNRLPLPYKIGERPMTIYYHLYSYMAVIMRFV